MKVLCLDTEHVVLIVSRLPWFPFPSSFSYLSITFLLHCSSSAVSSSFYPLLLFSIFLPLFPCLSQRSPPIAIFVFFAPYLPPLSEHLISLPVSYLLLLSYDLLLTNFFIKLSYTPTSTQTTSILLLSLDLILLAQLFPETCTFSFCFSTE